MNRGAAGRTELIAGPYGPLEQLITGAGDPVTVFAPGLGESITSTRPFGSGVAGTKAFFQFGACDAAAGGNLYDAAAGGGDRHRRAAAPEPAPAPTRPEESAWERLAAELLAVADHVAATRAVGASMGAVAILTGLTGPGRDPDRFDRVVLMLPPAADRVHLSAIADLVDRGDTAGLTRMLWAERSAREREDPRTRAWVRGAADRIAALGPALVTALARTPPPLTPERFATIRVPVLVVAQEDDPAHPVAAAQRWLELLPNATALMLPGGGLLTAHRQALREAVAGFLNGRLNFQVRAAGHAR